MNNKFKYAAFFDLDRTLIRLNSGESLIRNAYKQGYLRKRDMFYGFYLSLLYKFELREVTKIISKMSQWMKGLSKEQIDRLCEDIVKNELIGSIRPQMIEEIKHHRENNAELVILSAAMPEICNPFSTKLGMDKVICTELEVIDNKYTGRQVGNFCIGKEKLTRFKDHCENNNYSIADCYYYADSYSDLHVLDVVGYPICINPDEKLMKIAQNRSWVINVWQ